VSLPYADINSTGGGTRKLLQWTVNRQSNRTATHPLGGPILNPDSAEARKIHRILLGRALNRNYGALTNLLSTNPEVETPFGSICERPRILSALDPEEKDAIQILLTQPYNGTKLADEWRMRYVLETIGSYGSIIESLLAHPSIDFNLSDSDEETALLRAVERNHGALVELILMHPEIDVDFADESRGTTSLLEAVAKGAVGLAQLLLRRLESNGRLTDASSSNLHSLVAQLGREAASMLLTAYENDEGLLDTRSLNSDLKMTVSWVTNLYERNFPQWLAETYLQ
jgi:hypothetical protein